MKDRRAQSTIMDWDEAGDRSLMEWQEEEEPDRVKKRKRKSSKRSRRQCGVNNITNIPRREKTTLHWKSSISWWVLQRQK